MYGYEQCRFKYTLHIIKRVVRNAYCLFKKLYFQTDQENTYAIKHSNRNCVSMREREERELESEIKSHANFEKTLKVICPY